MFQRAKIRKRALTRFFRQAKSRKKKIIKGWVRTHRKEHTEPYVPDEWFDAHVYNDGVSDQKTIASNRTIIPTKYHYASIELILLREFFHRKLDFSTLDVCDIGSGAGHWLDFYQSITAKSCLSIEVSEKAGEYLKRANAHNDSVNVEIGFFQDILKNHENCFDLINAVGVIFHVVDDDDWLTGLKRLFGALRPNGLLVVGGHFGLLNNVNVQFNPDNTVNKRLRSGSHWRKTLETIGFKDIQIQKNRAYLYLKKSLPESNILFATKNSKGK